MHRFGSTWRFRLSYSICMYVFTRRSIDLIWTPVAVIRIYIQVRNEKSGLYMGTSTAFINEFVAHSESLFLFFFFVVPFSLASTFFFSSGRKKERKRRGEKMVMYVLEEKAPPIIRKERMRYSMFLYSLYTNHPAQT